MNKLINEFKLITRWPKKKIEKDFIIKWLSNKFDLKKTSIEIVMLIVPSKNKPKIRKIPIINSAQGSTKAIMFSMKIGVT